MDAMRRIERSLDQILIRAETDCPPQLAAAMRYSVFPGGARIRPTLCLAVAGACGDDDPDAADAAAGAIELLHCASLVHDDLPAFDDADMRRGKPSVHRAYGEPLAVLAGDSLIVLAFDLLAERAARRPTRLRAILGTVARSVGARGGLCAGQAWECEPQIALGPYHRAKTGALFAAAAVAGAAAAGAAHEPWRLFGETLGEAFQVADDLRDVVSDARDLGKPTGCDVAHRRPNAAAELGVSGAVKRLERLLAEAMAAIPSCPGRAELQEAVVAQTRRFLPKELAREAASAAA